MAREKATLAAWHCNACEDAIPTQMGLRIFFPHRMIVLQNADCRGFQIVELPPARTPNERGDGHPGQQKSDRQGDVDDTHDRAGWVRGDWLGCVLFDLGKAEFAAEIPRTERELIGINTAATIGLIKPAMHNATATAL